MKSQDLLTTEYYVKKWPYIVIYQHQNMSVSMWQELRRKLGTKMGCMVVKNTSINRIFKDEALSGGSMCLIGVSSMEDFKDLLNITNDYNYMLLIIGGYWNEQCWTHDDVKHISSLGSIHNIFNYLIDTMNQGFKFTSTLSQTNNLFISALNSNNAKICDTLALYNKQHVKFLYIYTIRVNPTAGSPTVTLLRLHSSCDMRSGTLFLYIYNLHIIMTCIK